MKLHAITSFLKEFFWITPFLCFLGGYQILNFFFRTHTIQTPCLIGKTVQQSLEILTHSQLNTRLIKEKEDPDLPEGMVLDQTPKPGQHIKPHQTIFLVASKHPAQKSTPQITGLFENEIKQLLKKERIRFKLFGLEVPHPEGLCIAQIPEPGAPLPPEGVISYYSQSNQTLTLFPQLEGLSLQEVLTFLENNGIKPQVFHSTSISNKHNCTYCTVKEQKPLPGSFVNLKEPFSVQLKV